MHTRCWSCPAQSVRKRQDGLIKDNAWGPKTPRSKGLGLCLCECVGQGLGVQGSMHSTALGNPSYLCDAQLPGPGPLKSFKVTLLSSQPVFFFPREIFIKQYWPSKLIFICQSVVILFFSPVISFVLTCAMPYLLVIKLFVDIFCIKCLHFKCNLDIIMTFFPTKNATQKKTSDFPSGLCLRVCYWS